MEGFESTCIAKGRCEQHDVEIERRNSDRKDIGALYDSHDKLEATFTRYDETNEARFVKLHERANTTGKMLYGVFGSVGLVTVIILGSFYYTRTVDIANDRGEEILLEKIIHESTASKLEREKLVDQVVSLLTSDAEQKQWQKGMIKQLELLNSHIKDIVEINHDNKRVTYPLYEGQDLR